MRRVVLKAFAFLLPLLAASAAAGAAELVYVHEAGCPYCRQWERQIGPIYGKTSEAQLAALRPIEKGAEALAKLKLDRPVRYTPTFVLVEDGIELGRIEGYPGESFFWAMLGRLMDKLPPDTADSASVGGVATADARHERHHSPGGAL